MEDGTVTIDNPAEQRIMLCGSIDFNNDLKEHFTALGFSEGNKKTQGTFVQEKAFGLPMYIDALIDRDKDVIHVVERVDGKRVFREYLHVMFSITKTVLVSLKVYLATNLNVWSLQAESNQKRT